MYSLIVEIIKQRNNAIHNVCPYVTPRAIECIAGLAANVSR
jgi:hypothetical protein